MALWFYIVLLRTNLAIASPVVVVAILARLIVCLGSVFRTEGLERSGARLGSDFGS